MSADEVDEYLAQLDEPKRSTREHLRRSIAAVIPEAEQVLSYGVPEFRCLREADQNDDRSSLPDPLVIGTYASGWAVA